MSSSQIIYPERNNRLVRKSRMYNVGASEIVPTVKKPNAPNNRSRQPRPNRPAELEQSERKVIYPNTTTKIVQNGKQYMLEGKARQVMKNGKQDKTLYFKKNTKNLEERTYVAPQHAETSIQDLGLLATRGTLRFQQKAKEQQDASTATATTAVPELAIDSEEVYIEVLEVNQLTWASATGPLPTATDESPTIYLDTVDGDDTNSGLTPSLPVASFSRAVDLANGYNSPIIEIAAGTTVDTGSDQTYRSRGKITIRSNTTTQLSGLEVQTVVQQTDYQTYTDITVTDTLVVNAHQDAILAFQDGDFINNYYRIVSNTANTFRIAGAVTVAAVGNLFDVYVPNGIIAPTAGSSLTLVGEWCIENTTVGLTNTDDLIVGKNSSLELYGTSFLMELVSMQNALIFAEGISTRLGYFSENTGSAIFVNSWFFNAATLFTKYVTLQMTNCQINDTSTTFDNNQTYITNTAFYSDSPITKFYSKSLFDNCTFGAGTPNTSLSLENSDATFLNNILFTSDSATALSVNGSSNIYCDTATITVDIDAGEGVVMFGNSNINLSNSDLQVTSSASISYSMRVESSNITMNNSSSLVLDAATVTQPALLLNGGSSLIGDSSTLTVSPTTTVQHGLQLTDGSKFVLDTCTTTLNGGTTSNDGCILLQRGCEGVFNGGALTLNTTALITVIRCDFGSKLTLNTFITLAGAAPTDGLAITAKSEVITSESFMTPFNTATSDEILLGITAITVASLGAAPYQNDFGAGGSSQGCEIYAFSP